MATADSLKRKLKWQQRRADWLADHPCKECGSPDSSKTMWGGLKEDQPLRSMTEAYRLGGKLGRKYLDQCYALCYDCWRLGLKKNVHGGGKTGIADCNCALCARARRIYYNAAGRAQTARARERREKAIEMGMALPKGSVGWDNNWNNSDKGKRYKRSKRYEHKVKWLEGRTCDTCGTADHVVPVWKEYPGPLASTGSIWGYGQPKRDELLEKCHTLCVSCSRYAREARKREKSNER